MIVLRNRCDAVYCWVIAELKLLDGGRRTCHRSFLQNALHSWRLGISEGGLLERRETPLVETSITCCRADGGRRDGCTRERRLQCRPHTGGDRRKSEGELGLRSASEHFDGLWMMNLFDFGTLVRGRWRTVPESLPSKADSCTGRQRSIEKKTRTLRYMQKPSLSYQDWTGQSIVKARYFQST